MDRASTDQKNERKNQKRTKIEEVSKVDAKKIGDFDDDIIVSLLEMGGSPYSITHILKKRSSSGSKNIQGKKLRAKTKYQVAQDLTTPPHIPTTYSIK